MTEKRHITPGISKPHIGKDAQGWFVQWMDWDYDACLGISNWVEHKTFSYPTAAQAWYDYARWVL
jgi:hypothetical protein